VRRVLPSLFLAPPTTKRKQQSNPPKLTTHPTQSHPSTQREKQGKKPLSRERKILFACFVAVLVTWMSFASGERELRGGVLSMLETHIVMSLLIFRLVPILMFHLAFTLVLFLAPSHVLCLALLLVLCLSSLMDLTIAHMVLVHERTALNLYALVTAHVLIVVTVSRVGLISPLEGPFPTLSRDIWTVYAFPIVVHVPLDQVVRCKGL
jgi:flagellar biosynthesis protein FlhB